MTRQAPHESRGAGGGVLWLLFSLLAILVVGLGWLGLVSALGTDHPFEATVGTSMLPVLRTGDLVVLSGVAPQDIRVGDIVAVHPSAEDQAKYHYPATVMHRVERLSLDNSTLMVQTKGDNQGSPDPFTVPASNVEGRLVYSIPKVGWALFYLRSKQGLIAIGGLLVLYLVYAATKWIAETEDEPYEPGPAAGEFSELAMAINEYGEHLRSHTRVVEELGGTTAELHVAAVTQNDVLDDLRQVLLEARSRSNAGPAIAGQPSWPVPPPLSLFPGSGGAAAYPVAPSALPPVAAPQEIPPAAHEQRSLVAAPLVSWPPSPPTRWEWNPEPVTPAAWCPIPVQGPVFARPAAAAVPPTPAVESTRRNEPVSQQSTRRIAPAGFAYATALVLGAAGLVAATLLLGGGRKR